MRLEAPGDRLGHQTTATWAGNKTTVLGIWGARGESAASLAERTGELLATLDEVVGSRQWLLADDRPFPPDPGARAAAVEECVTRDAHGDPTPDAGVSFALFSSGPRVAVTVSVLAGGAVPTRRVAPNRVVVELVPADHDALSPSVVDAIFRGCVRAWSPASAAFRDSGLASASQGRGGYAPLVGYRSWLSHEAGAVGTVVDGLELETSEEGSWVDAPDDWPAERVAAAVLASWDGNAIGPIPRGD